MCSYTANFQSLIEGAIGTTTGGTHTTNVAIISLPTFFKGGEEASKAFLNCVWKWDLILLSSFYPLRGDERKR